MFQKNIQILFIMGDSITNLKTLHETIKFFKLNYVIGERTVADGNCFTHACYQSILHYKDLGQWRGVVPDSIDHLRADVIKYMEVNKNYWTRPRFNSCLKRMEDPPLNDVSFMDILESQR